MMTCEVCGNDYDSFEFAIHALAPLCADCGCAIIGHGVEEEGAMYCCASCARREGAGGVVDRAEALLSR